MTTWLPVVGFECRYEVSDDGRIKVLGGPGRGRRNEDRVLKIKPNTNGYYAVLLYPGGGAHYVAKRVHQVMLEAFVGPTPPGAFGLHNDDDRTNNTVGNLRWGTRSENSYDMVANGNHNHARKTHCKHGHPLSGDNLIVTKRQRFCRACRRRRHEEYQARKRAYALAVLTADTAAKDVAS